MSSHHFVKEGQEPALLILNTNITEETASLLEWAPLVMVCATAVPNVVQRGIKIDIIFWRKEDSLTDVETLIKDQGPVTLLTYDADSWLCGSADVHTEWQPRHGIARMLCPFLAKEPFSRQILITIFDGCWKSSVITGGRYEKWLPEKSVLKIHGPDAAQLIVTEGLTPSGLLFEAISSGIVHVHSAGTFWVSEQYC